MVILKRNQKGKDIEEITEIGFFEDEKRAWKTLIFNKPIKLKKGETYYLDIGEFPNKIYLNGKEICGFRVKEQNEKDNN